MSTDLKIKNLEKIDERYSGLAESSCCLSCGGAVDRAAAQRGENCVDLGSGRGTDVLRMAEVVGPEGFVWGIDTSHGMLKKARKTATKLGVSNVNFMKADLENLPLDDNSADLVISNCTINHASNKEAVWAEIFRILKPGGRFVVSDIYATDTVPDNYRNDPTAVAECWAGAVTKNIYMNTLEKTGFAPIKIIEESAPYPKGEIDVSSFTINGIKPAPRKCCD